MVLIADVDWALQFFRDSVGLSKTLAWQYKHIVIGTTSRCRKEAVSA